MEKINNDVNSGNQQTSNNASYFRGRCSCKDRQSIIEDPINSRRRQERKFERGTDIGTNGNVVFLQKDFVLHLE